MRGTTKDMEDLKALVETPKSAATTEDFVKKLGDWRLDRQQQIQVEGGGPAAFTLWTAAQKLGEKVVPSSHMATAQGPDDNDIIYCNKAKRRDGS